MHKEDELSCPGTLIAFWFSSLHLRLFFFQSALLAGSVY